MKATAGPGDVIYHIGKVILSLYSMTCMAMTPRDRSVAESEIALRIVALAAQPWDASRLHIAMQALDTICTWTVQWYTLWDGDLNLGAEFCARASIGTTIVL